MLLSLNLKNFAIIDDLSIDFGKGLNIITGETGAGKSIIVDAINIILGDRASSDLIKSGQEEAQVEALFDIGENKHLRNKLESLGLVEIQRTRPKLYSALPAEVVVERLAEIAAERAADFARRVQPLREALANLPGRLHGRQPFVDLALGTESHVKRHLARLAMSRRRILSYMEESDLDAIDLVAQGGFDVLKRIGRNCSARQVDHRIVFGFSDRTAPRLLDFLHRHS